MKLIQIDASNWKSLSDFYDSLLAVIGAPDWHGHSIGALVDSMIFGDREINRLHSPYTIKISGLAGVPAEVADEVRILREELISAPYHRGPGGEEIDVRIEIEDQ